MLAALRPETSDLESVGGVSALPMRIAAVETRLLRDGPSSFVLGLDRLLTEVLQRPSRRSADVVFACAMWIVRDASAHLERLRQSAARNGCTCAAAILTEAPAHKALARGGRLADPSIGEAARLEGYVPITLDLDAWYTAPDPESETELQLISSGAEDASLYLVRVPYRAPFGVIEELDHVDPTQYGQADDVGEEGLWRRRLRRASRGALDVSLAPIAARRRDALVRHSSSFTIRRLLAARLLTASDAVRIAARRPTTPAIAREVATSLRWMSVPAVREALVSNPFTPTELALAFLPTLRRTRVREIARVANVHPRIRDAARLLLGVPQGSGA
jgi:hypothetical protein